MIKIRPVWIVLIVIACAFVLCGSWVWRLTKNLCYLSADAKRVRLLYKTDHEALLKACRSLMAQKDSNSLNMDYWYVEDGEIYRIYGNFREAGLPEVIVKLDPVFIHIYKDNRVLIECVAAFYSVSVQAYPIGVMGGGDKMLLEGLWYWDIGYEKHKDFDKYLERLNPELNSDTE